MIISLIRHSTTLFNEIGMPSGGMVDCPLSEKGIELIKELKEKGIYDKDPGVLYCSSLIRSRQTLNIIYPGEIVYGRKELDEYHFGEMELQENTEKLKEWLTLHPFPTMWTDYEFKPIGGESINEFIARVRKDFRKLYDEFTDKGYKKVTICGHGAYFKAMYKAFNNPFNLDPLNYFVYNGMGVTYDVKLINDELIFEPLGFIGGNSITEVGKILNS